MQGKQRRIILYKRNGEQATLGDRSEHKPSIILFESPRFPKFPLARFFFTPVPKMQLGDHSNALLPATQNSTVVVFTSVHHKNNRDWYAKMIPESGWFAFQTLSSVLLFWLTLAIVFPLIGGVPRLTLATIILTLPWFYIRAANGDLVGIYTENSHKYMRESRVKKAIEHDSLKYPWKHCCLLGSTHYVAKLPIRVTYEELMSGKLSIASHLKKALGLRSHHEKKNTVADNLSSSEIMFTIHPALSDDKGNTLALIAIPDSNPDGGILILPEPENMDEAITEILQFSESPESEQQPVDKASPEPAPQKAEYDRSTRSFIDRNSTPEVFRDWAAREAKAVSFLKKYDEHREKTPDGSINAIVKKIDDLDTSLEKESVRHMKTHLTEREAREFFHSRYPELRNQTQDLHPEETAERIAAECKKKTVREYILDIRKMLCIGAHYADFFRMADELKESESLNWLQVSRKIAKEHPKRFPFHSTVYHYHLLQRNAGNDSWQSKLV
jgi:hypothetical protein